MTLPLSNADGDMVVIPKVSTIFAPLSLLTLPETNLSECCFYFKGLFSGVCFQQFSGVFSGTILVCLYILGVLGAACEQLKLDPTWLFVSLKRVSLT